MDTNEYNRNFYSDLFEKEPERYYRIQQKKMKIVASLFEKHAEGRILDVGCGDGLIATFIADKTGATLFGVDISHSSVSKAAKKRNSGKGNQHRYRRIPVREGEL